MIGLRARHLDEEARDAVVGELQRGNARAFAFAALELEQEFVGVRGDLAQLVELGVVARRDHVAVAQHDGGFFGDRALQEVDDVGVFVDGVRELDDQAALRCA